MGLFLTNTVSEASPTALLENANLKQLETRRYWERTKLFYLLYHGQLGRTHTYLCDANRWPTRSYHSKKVTELTYNTNIFQYPLSFKKYNWNSLPTAVVECSTVSSYLHALESITHWSDVCEHWLLFPSHLSCIVSGTLWYNMCTKLPVVIFPVVYLSYCIPLYVFDL